jgi:hypothetical protein
LLNYDLFSKLKAYFQDPRQKDTDHHRDTRNLDLVYFPDKCKYNFENDGKHDETCPHAEQLLSHYFAQALAT